MEVTPSVLRNLKMTGEIYAIKESTKKQKVLEGFDLRLGEDHPIYHVLNNETPQINQPYAWYIRVPDIVDFLNHIHPILENCLSNSYVVGHTGELKLNFYSSGAVLYFNKSKIKVEFWDTPNFQEAHINFPDLSFLKILFGH